MNLTNHYFNWEDGVTTPVDSLQELKFLDPEECRIDAYKPSSLVFLSTVFLHINHNWGEGEPVLFETMLFVDFSDVCCERACTEEQAREIHAKWAKVADGVSSDLIKLGSRRRIKKAIDSLNDKYAVYMCASDIPSNIAKRIYQARMNNLAS